jgi:hypothetical protein
MEAGFELLRCCKADGQIGGKARVAVFLQTPRVPRDNAQGGGRAFSAGGGLGGRTRRGAARTQGGAVGMPLCAETVWKMRPPF